MSSSGLIHRPRRRSLAVAVPALMVLSVWLIGSQMERLPWEPHPGTPEGGVASEPSIAPDEPPPPPSAVVVPEEVAQRRVEEPEPAQVTLLLRAEVRGRAMSSLASFPGAEVVVRDNEARVACRAPMGEDGCFSVRVEGEGPLFLTIERLDEALSPVVELAHRIGKVALKDDSPWPIVDMGAIEVGGSIPVELRMVDEPSGQPVLGVHYWLLPVAQDRGLRGLSSSRSDALGTSDLHPQYLGMDARGEGLSLALRDWSIGMQLLGLSTEFGGHQTIGASGALVAGQGITLSGEPWREVLVKVQQDGEPVVGADVWLFGFGGWRQQLLALELDDSFELPLCQSTKSDQGGLARITTLTSAGGSPRDWRLSVSHRDHGFASVTLDDQVPTPLPVELPGRWVAQGQRFRFIDPSGHPVMGVACTLDKEELAPTEDGWFLLEEGRAMPRPAYLIARAAGKVSRRVHLGKADWREKEFELVEGGAFEVRVTDEAGVALEGVGIHMRTKPYTFGLSVVHSDELGRALLEGVPLVGERSLRVAELEPALNWRIPDRDRNPALVSIPPGEMSADIVLERETRARTSFRVSARDAVSGALESLQRLQFTTLDARGHRLRSPRSVSLGIEEAVIADALLGSYIAWVVTTSGKKGVVAFELTQGDHEITCLVSKGRDLEGRVTFGSGLDAHPSRVVARVSGLPPEDVSPDESIWPSYVGATSDGAGGFVLKGLLPSVYGVEVVRPISSAAPQLVDVAGCDGPLEISWLPASGISISIQGGTWASTSQRVRLRYGPSGESEESSLTAIDLLSMERSPEVVTLSTPEGSFRLLLEEQTQSGEWLELGRRTVEVQPSRLARVEF